MGPLAIAAIGALLGAAKGSQDEANARKAHNLNSEKIRYSPWTRINPDPVKEGDMFGSMMQGGLAGAALGQGISNMADPVAAAAAPAQAYIPGQGMGMMAESASPWGALSPMFQNGAYGFKPY